jgi:hypothetical protein
MFMRIAFISLAAVLTLTGCRLAITQYLPMTMGTTEKPAAATPQI